MGAAQTAAAKIVLPLKFNTTAAEGVVAGKTAALFGFKADWALCLNRRNKPMAADIKLKKAAGGGIGGGGASLGGRSGRWHGRPYEGGGRNHSVSVSFGQLFKPECVGILQSTESLRVAWSAAVATASGLSCSDWQRGGYRRGQRRPRHSSDGGSQLCCEGTKNLADPLKVRSQKSSIVSVHLDCVRGA